ncbi:MAG TPA: hypothetical protein VHG08_15990 [Longimicrobium sp.]|nr:hypothetical protein [Longimicrobium sp.]
MEVLDSFVQRLSLIAVAAVGHLEVLRGLHGEVIVPQAVWGEVTKPHRPVVIVVSALLSGQRWS